MLEIAKECNALDMILPDSDFICPEGLIDLVGKYMRLGYNDFSPNEGVESLREQIISLVNRENHTDYKAASDITITAGTSQAMSTAISTFVKDGEEVIIFEPVQESYAPFIEMSGGRHIFVNLRYPEYRIDWDEVKKLVTSKTRMIILQNPQNPIGRLFQSEDLDQLKRMINGTRIVVLCNEVYNNIVFDNQKFKSIASVPELASKSLIVSSFGTIFNISGWGISYIVGSDKLMSEFRKVHQYQGFSLNTPAQFALGEFLQKEQKFSTISAYYQEKRDHFAKMLGDSNFEIVPTHSTFYQLLDYGKISDEPDSEFAVRLIKEFGIAAMPFSAFHHEKTKNQLIRICFAKSDEVLEDAARRFKKVPLA